MIVILMKDVKGAGKAGDVVKVSDGYARNMLLPKGLAKEATEGNIRSLEKQKAIAAEKHEEQKAAAKALAEKLEKITLEIKTKGGETGKLFGSITSKDIAEALEKQENVKIDKKKSIYFLDTYLPSLVDTIISSPSSINRGTLTSIPVSTIASLVALVAVLPLIAGSVLVIL